MARTNGKLSYHKRIVNLLTDGEFHSFREIYRAVARYIDRQVADREYRKRHRDWAKTWPDVRVAAGKKRLVFLSLNRAIHHRQAVEARGRDWDREYRLTREALAARQETKA
jgi:hypothetical protein